MVAKFTKGAEKWENKENDISGKEVMTVLASPLLCWELYVDKVANKKGSRIWMVMISPE